MGQASLRTRRCPSSPQCGQHGSSLMFPETRISTTLELLHFNNLFNGFLEQIVALKVIHRIPFLNCHKYDSNLFRRSRRTRSPRMNTFLLNRDIAAVPLRSFHVAQTARLFTSIQRSSRKRLKKRHFGAVNALDIERINGR